MDEALARLNVDRFRRLLGEEQDEAKRATLSRLLDEEVARLRALRPPRGKPSRDQRLASAPPSPQQ